MSHTLVKTVSFGASRAGLTTVGYTLSGGARTTSGVSEVAAGTGIYRASIVFPDGFAGTLLWDTGGSTPRYAAEEINPDVATPGLRAMAAVLAGDLAEVENADGTATTSTFRDFGDPATARVTAVSTRDARTVTAGG